MASARGLDTVLDLPVPKIRISRKSLAQSGSGSAVQTCTTAGALS